MCLVAVAIDAHPRYRLVVAANRDEFHRRASAAAAEWRERAGIYGGRDLLAGGAWMAADRRGRLALVTNVRAANRGGAASRGLLVRDLLLGDAPIESGLAALAARIDDYAPFNLIAGHAGRLHYLGSTQATPIPLSAAIHTLSNAALDTPWPKTRRLESAMRQWCKRGDGEPDALFDALGDTATAADAELPDTGIGLDRERFLSAAFIVGEPYGTRCSTIFMVDRNGNARMVERSFGPLGVPLGRAHLQWRIELA